MARLVVSCILSPTAFRSPANAVVATVQPPPTGPSTAEVGTSTSSRNTSQKLAPPVICRSGRTSTPGADIDTRNMVSPRCLGAWGSVRTRASPTSANWALDVHTFCPVSCQLGHRDAAGAHACQIGSRRGLGEQLAGNDVAALDRYRVARSARRADGDDRRADGAEAHPQWAHIRNVEGRLDLPVEPIVLAGQAGAAEFRWTGYPAEPSRPSLPLPLPGRGRLRPFFVARRLVKQREPFGSVTPCHMFWADPFPPTARNSTAASEFLFGRGDRQRDGSSIDSPLPLHVHVLDAYVLQQARAGPSTP